MSVDKDLQPSFGTESRKAKKEKRGAMGRKDYPRLTRNGYAEQRNERKRDNCRENQRRIKRGKAPMRRVISNNRAAWKAS